MRPSSPTPSRRFSPRCATSFGPYSANSALSASILAILGLSAQFLYSQYREPNHRFIHGLLGAEAQKRSHAVQLRPQFTLEDAIARWRSDIANLGLELAVFHGEVAPANHAVAPTERQSVIAEPAFGRRRVGFETVDPAPQQLEAGAVPHHRVERRQQAHLVLRRMARRVFRIIICRPIPVDAINARMREPISRPLQGTLQLAAPLRHGKAQPAHKGPQACTGQRRVDADDYIV